MSNSVAALPTGQGVTVIAEHRQRREDEQQRSSENDSRGDHAAGDQPRRDDLHRESHPPADEVAPVPAETLFAATLLANALPPRLPSSDEMRLRHSQGWMPPDSALRLRDKLI
jgi:hypothetical protein